MKPEGAMKLMIACDLSECAYDDAKIMIVNRMVEDGVPAASGVSYMLTTMPELECVYQHLLTRFLREANVERNEDFERPLYLYVESMPKLMHRIDTGMTYTNEWCLTGYGLVGYTPFQYTVWSEGA